MFIIEIAHKTKFEGNEIRFVDGKPVANDVAAVLGYKDPANAVHRLVFQQNKGVCDLQTPGGMQSVTFLEEAGIYQLIFSSKLESAQKFQQWVFEEVLPSIRKTGSYGVRPSVFTNPDLQDALALIDSAFWYLPAERTAQIKINVAGKINPTLATVLTETRQLAINSTASDSQLLTVTAIGEKIGKSGKWVNQQLILLGYQIKNLNKKSHKDPMYIPTEKGKEFAQFTIAEGLNSTYQQLRWHNNVIDVLAECTGR